jgi:hypothetical protein
MSRHTTTDRFPQLRRHSIAYQHSHFIEGKSTIFRNERIRCRERLKYRGLSERDGTVLFGMSEATVPIAEALRRHCRGGFIPRHATIH